eukprot:3554846-Alexandrium_andersonii.AAC.1
MAHGGALACSCPAVCRPRVQAGATQEAAFSCRIGHAIRPSVAPCVIKSIAWNVHNAACLLYTSPSPRD